jgi:hypothetical protein
VADGIAKGGEIEKRHRPIEFDRSPSPPQFHQLDQRRRRRNAAADAKLDEFGHVDPAAP